MENQKLILVVEDNPDMRLVVSAALSKAGYRVVPAEGLKAGLAVCAREKPDLIVLDVSLPDGSGFEVCQKIRDSKALHATPIIMLTGQDKAEDKRAGFSAGADQYLIKPIQTDELLMWVEALLRRVSIDREEEGDLAVGDLSIAVKSRLVSFQGQPVAGLTAKEFDILLLLVRKRPQVLSRKQILSKVWDTLVFDRTVDVHISNLKKKLPQFLADRIQNLPGQGYRFLQA